MSPTFSHNFVYADLTYHWNCARCATVADINWHSLPGSAVPRPTLPDGWRELDGRFYCPAHEIALLVDGEAVE